MHYLKIEFVIQFPERFVLNILRLCIANLDDAVMFFQSLNVIKKSLSLLTFRLGFKHEIYIRVFKISHIVNHPSQDILGLVIFSASKVLQKLSG